MAQTREAKHQYYLKNREYIIKRNTEYKKNNAPLHHRDVKSHLRYILGKAKLRKQVFNIVAEDLYDLWDKQNGLCAYSRLPLNNRPTDLQLASLDRIDSSIGYEKGNIQLVCSAVNRMKQEFSEQDFLYFCEHIANTNKKNTQ